MQTAQKLTAREKYGYSVGFIGEGLAFNLVSSFLMVYCTDILGITAGFMATLFFFARLWDAANDPLMGLLAENINTKWGKHRPWVLLGAVTNALVVAFMFWPGAAGLAHTGVYIAVMYVLFDFTYTIIDVPFYAYAASFTDPAERDQISAFPRIVGGVSMVADRKSTRLNSSH